MGFLSNPAPGCWKKFCWAKNHCGAISDDERVRHAHFVRRALPVSIFSDQRYCRSGCPSARSGDSEDRHPAAFGVIGGHRRLIEEQAPAIFVTVRSSPIVGMSEVAQRLANLDTFQRTTTRTSSCLPLTAATSAALSPGNLPVARRPGQYPVWRTSGRRSIWLEAVLGLTGDARHGVNHWTTKPCRSRTRS